MHIYVFGSVCRGEVDLSSDVDLLAITDKNQTSFNPDVYSIYSYKKINSLWSEGNPFAWHLFAEARLAFASDASDYIKGLGQPAVYKKCAVDCQKFSDLFSDAMKALDQEGCSTVFELSNMFLAMRNFATCYALGIQGDLVFSRDAALHIGKKSVPIEMTTHSLLEHARILSTRGIGQAPNLRVEPHVNEIKKIHSWMIALLEEVRNG